MKIMVLGWYFSNDLHLWKIITILFIQKEYVWTLSFFGWSNFSLNDSISKIWLQILAWQTAIGSTFEMDKLKNPSDQF